MAYGSILGQSFETSPVLDNYFTKDETLTSSTAALFGLGADAVPDDVLEKARELITAAQNAAASANSNASSRATIVTGSYVGTGTSGEDNPTVINIGSDPKVVFISGNGRTIYAVSTWVYNRTTFPVVRNSSIDNCEILSTNPFRFYNQSNPALQLNQSGDTYYWVAIY